MRSRHPITLGEALHLADDPHVPAHIRQLALDWLAAHRRNARALV